MDLTIPLMTTEMLKFPKLCFQYFDLLSHLCEIYPQKICELPASSLQMLMCTIDFGLSLPETKALRLVLESLESLAKYQWEKRQIGETALPDAIVQGQSCPQALLKVCFCRQRQLCFLFHHSNSKKTVEQ